MTHVTCRLTAKNRDQLRNPTLGNRVWASFTFFTQVSRHQKGNTNLDFTEARDSEWQLIAEVSGETRDGSFLFQRLSVLIQPFNAVLLHDCFVDEVVGHSSQFYSIL